MKNVCGRIVYSRVCHAIYHLSTGAAAFSNSKIANTLLQIWVSSRTVLYSKGSLPSISSFLPSCFGVGAITLSTPMFPFAAS